MNDSSRREFMKAVGVIAAAATLPFSRGRANWNPINNDSDRIPFNLGIASYTFRLFTLDQTIAMTSRLGLKRITLKDMHLSLLSSETEIKAALDKIRRAGLELTSCGVVYMKTEEEVHQAFAYAAKAGLRVLVGAPDEVLLPIAEQEVKARDIELAIHNHGPTDQRFPSPESAYKLIEHMDKRMGLCIDVGHTQRLGLDPSAEVKRFSDRLFDVHLKDVTSADAAGTTIEIGRGVIDIPKLLKTLASVKYAHTLHFEFEKDEKDPLPGVAESVGYVRGVIASM